MTWLIVEDEADIRIIVQTLCSVWGHDTLTFPDGEKAWRWLDDVEGGSFREELPELALLDIRMPGHTGDAVAGRMRQIEALRHIAIVLMTAYELSDGDRERIMSTSGADHMIFKPLPDMEELKILLHGILERKKARCS